MAWSDPQDYTELFELMWQERDKWSDFTNAAGLAENLTSKCPGLVGGTSESQVGDRGFAALRAALAESYWDEDRLAERVRQLALSRPATEHGLGPEWADFHITENAEGGKFYATSRFAEPGEWQPVPAAHDATSTAAELVHDPGTGLLHDDEHWYLPDGVTVVTQDPVHLERFTDDAGNVYVRGVLWRPPAELTDASGPVYDEETGRWRRLDPASGEWEFYHHRDQVWERRDRLGLWNRRHGATGWLPYDAPSRTWLFEGRWLTGDQVGAGRPATGDAHLLTRLTADRLSALRAATEEIRAGGVGPDELSDDAISGLFDAEVLANLNRRSA